MPTPVSTFSPFTPFTPATSTHNSGGYFDRPAAGNLCSSSPLARRPDMRNSGVGSSSSLRMSRVTGASDTLRQPSENGWRVASRMRDEAWSAWEQQLGNLSLNTTQTTNLSLLRPSTKLNLSYPNPEAGSESDKRRIAASEGVKLFSNSARFASDFHFSQMAPGPHRSISSNGLDRPSGLDAKRRSFDPSFLHTHARIDEMVGVSAN